MTDACGSGLCWGRKVLEPQVLSLVDAQGRPMHMMISGERTDAEQNERRKRRERK